MGGTGSTFTMDIFQYHNTVINQQPDRQCDAPQTHDIQTDIIGIHQIECRNYRNGDGNGDN